MKHLIILLVVCSLYSCSFQPGDATNILIFRKEDTLIVEIIDSEHLINKYSTKEKYDTLFINIKSLRYPYPNEEKHPLTQISINRHKISYVKLQDDRIYSIDSIPEYAH